MEDAAIIHLWKSYDKKLEESLSLNKKNAEDIMHMKVRSFLASMKPSKIFALLVGIGWVILADIILIGTFHIASPFFLVSAGIQVLLTKLAIGIYLYQLILIQRVDISEPILSTQEKLSRLKSSSLWCARILFLQLPVWTTFYLTPAMLASGNPWLLLLQLAVTTAFFCAAIWLFINIRYSNRHKKWFRAIFQGKEWDPVIKAMALLEQVEEYRR
ncbi:hypothetical protein ACTJJ0_29125 [Chitinophaga sp. 22321]|uniref:RDD family protein n=1 Tax=Chitinophaga hostae TaxID=2831022 RepID=A0ABS5J762_9BACT|nr:hypothetical protein [Chitinophaga hostae]MBS0031057.1 hypothetical protein [Chitinophaga hostae]